MDAWIIGLVAGGVLLLVLVGVLRVVVKAAATTAETAQAILVALEDVKSSTASLGNLGQFDPETLGPSVGPDVGGDARNPVETGKGEVVASSPNGTGAVDPGAGAEEHREKEG